MVKYVIILFIFIIGCEINSEQLIKSENISFDNIKFNTVSKNLKFSNNQDSSEVDATKRIIEDWFNKNIKVDGFDGNLSVDVTSIEIDTIKKDEYFRFEINLYIDFLETNQDLNKRKIYKVNSIEYGDIQGSFSIKDVETLKKNTIIKSLKSISQKLLEI